jgi:hypothetical protein
MGLAIGYRAAMPLKSLGEDLRPAFTFYIKRVIDCLSIHSFFPKLSVLNFKMR